MILFLRLPDGSADVRVESDKGVLAVTRRRRLMPNQMFFNKNISEVESGVYTDDGKFFMTFEQWRERKEQGDGDVQR